jgi:hypothetical protein
MTVCCYHLMYSPLLVSSQSYPPSYACISLTQDGWGELTLFYMLVSRIYPYLDPSLLFADMGIMDGNTFLAWFIR